MKIMEKNHKFPFRWYLKDGYPAKGIKKHNLKVFGTFICGGGSTMGYKLAGFDHLGGVEIDKPIAEVYNENHHPKYLFNEDIRDFRKRNDIPKELYDLDILDGSPPCSTFSTAGSREEAWGVKKKFREGQTAQTLDDLFFEFIALAKKLQPKVVLAENVSGLIKGNAKAYVHQIRKEFDEAGYNVQLFLLNAASMGVPQKRERVFFICSRKDLKMPKLKLDFNEKPILYKEIAEDTEYTGVKGKYFTYWQNRIQSDTCIGDITERIGLSRSGFNTKLVRKNAVCDTLVSGSEYHNFDTFGYLSLKEHQQIGSFPLDYNFLKVSGKYLIGMSVPPLMTAQIAHQIYLQLFNK